MEQSAEGTGLIVRGGVVGFFLIDLATGEFLDAPPTDLEALGQSLGPDGTLTVTWICDGGEWLLEPTHDQVDIVWYRWSQNSDLLGKKVEGVNVLVQPAPNQPRQPLPIASLRPRVWGEAGAKGCNEVLRELKRDLLLVNDHLVVVPRDDESVADLQKAIEKELTSARNAAEADEAIKRAEAAAAAVAARDRRSLEYAEGSSAADIFVNPYNYIPLPESVPREAPCGHDRQHEGRRSGRIAITWTARSPLLFGDGQTKGLETDPSGGYRVSGTSLKGSLRSLHEAITGSCLRVFDEEFVPVYRQPAAVQPGRQLAVVSEVDRLGRPSKVRLCGGAHWARIDTVHRARQASDLRSGDLFEVTRAESRSGRGRNEFGANTELKFLKHLRAEDVPSAAGSWVVLLSDAAARNKRYPYYAPLGVIGAADAPLSPDVADLWTIEVEGADDVRVRRQGNNEDRWKSITFAGSAIGQRRTVPAMPAVGDVLWADVVQGRVVRLATSYLWRKTGTGAAGERVPRPTLACGSPTLHDLVPDGHLCMSCRCFGSAGNDRSDDRQGSRQRSYRGQVRISDMRVAVDGALTPQSLPPRGKPRPGSGQFSLVIRDTEPDRDSAFLPAAAWGSRRETTPIRPLRGRKFYWHGHTTEAQGGWRRDVARNHQAQRNMGAQSVRLIPVGGSVTAELWFENLSDVELGSLIAALHPTMLLADERHELLWRRLDEQAERRPNLWTHLGGGKGLGLGSVEVTSLTVAVEHPDRYRGAVATELSPQQQADLVAAFRAHASDRMAASWKELAAMLDPDRVDPKRVAYPPNRGWDSLQATNPDSHEVFDKTYEFFQASRGGGVGRKPEPVTPLPSPSDDRPWLTIIEGR